jgi:hypothetical protein
MWYYGDVMSQIRHLAIEQINSKKSLSKMNREEMFTETVLQPSLRDYSRWGEFVDVVLAVLYGAVMRLCSFVMLMDSV